MHILKDHQHWILTRQRLHLRGERFKRSLPALLRTQLQRWIAPIIWEGQHFGKERGILSGGRGLRQ